MHIDESVVQLVWEKGREISNRNPNMWRQDQCGAWLHREQYDNANSEYGWKILKVAPGSGDNVDDLRPFHCNNNFDIANGRAQCRITADRADLAPSRQVDPPRNVAV